MSNYSTAFKVAGKVFAGPAHHTPNPAEESTGPLYYVCNLLIILEAPFCKGVLVAASAFLLEVADLVSTIEVVPHLHLRTASDRHLANNFPPLPSPFRAGGRCWLQVREGEP